MTVIFISGPYSAQDAVVKRQNIRQAREAANAVWARGMVAICPHTNSGDFDGVAPERTFLDGYLELVHRSDAVLSLPGWEQSRGSRAEIAEAAAYGIPVFSSVDTLTDAQVPPRCGRACHLRP